MTTKRFWIATGERAAKTAAQTALAVSTLGMGFNAFVVNWGDVAGVALGGAVVSILTSIASSGVGGDGSPSLVGEQA